MKGCTALLFVCLLFLSCRNEEKKEEKQMERSEKRSEKDYEKGLALVAKHRCLICHNVEDRLTGPSYREIANRYAAYPDSIIPFLGKRVITGGNGSWGEVRMTPHPQVSQKEAEAMVRYILMLKSN
jgi:cytochrome c